jgi:Ca-activated chloride channel family protein
MMVRSFFGTRKVNPSADLDEKTLKAIAEETGGRYFRARNTKEFEGIYELLDTLEPIEQEKQVFRPRTALYPWPLGVALLIAALVLLERSLPKMGFSTKAIERPSKIGQENQERSI